MVLSPFGRPVSGATVAVATPYRDRDRPPLRLTTDRDGRFRSGRCLNPESPGLVLVVRARDLPWAVHHVARAPADPPRVIRLTRCRPLEGRVADAQGRPVAGALVTTSRDVFGGLLGWEARPTRMAASSGTTPRPPARSTLRSPSRPSHRLARRSPAPKRARSSSPSVASSPLPAPGPARLTGRVASSAAPARRRRLLRPGHLRQPPAPVRRVVADRPE